LGGVNLNKEIKTVTVEYIENKASIVNPQLSQLLTEKFRNKFLKETSLKMVSENADLQFKGTITNYNVTNAAQQGGNTVATNRLTIVVQMKCTNTKDPEQNYDMAFEKFADFSGDQTLTAVEARLVGEISDLLVQEMYNKAVLNW
jgi:hypothetical protein